MAGLSRRVEQRMMTRKGHRRAPWAGRGWVCVEMLCILFWALTHTHTWVNRHQALHWKASASYCLWIKPHWKRQTVPSRGRILGENKTVVRVHLKLYLFISWCGPFLKSLLNLWQYFVCFMFWFFWPRSIWDLSSPTRDPYTPCIGRQSLNYWTTREVHELKLLNQLHRTSRLDSSVL